MLLLKILVAISIGISLFARPLGTIVTYLLLGGLAYWLCRVDPQADCSWYHGIWHGLFFAPNMFVNWLISDNVHYYSHNGSFFYYVWLYLMNLGIFGSVLSGKR